MVKARGGQLWIDVTVGGRRVRRPAGTSDVQAARLEDLRVRRALERGEPLDTGVLTLGEAVRRTYDKHYAPRKSAGVVRYVLDRIVAELGEATLLSSVDEHRLDKWVVSMRERGLTGATINRYLSALRRVMKVNRVAPPVVPTLPEAYHRERVVSRDEERRMLAHFRTREDHDMADLVTVLVDTGFRLSEALRLDAKCVNWGTNQVTAYETKGGKPRSVPMTRRVAAVMRRRMVGPAFPLTKDTAARRWAVARSAMPATMQDIVLHSLRHTCATRLLEAGVDIYRVKTWLGHASVTTTEGYAHVSVDMLRDGAAALQAAHDEGKMAALRLAYGG
jgi:integrase